MSGVTVLTRHTGPETVVAHVVPVIIPTHDVGGRRPLPTDGRPRTMVVGPPGLRVDPKNGVGGLVRVV